MSEALLNYLNKEIKLSKKIKYLDQDFKNGYLFAEVLSTTGFLTPNELSLFNKDAKTKPEIKQNYLLLKENLQNLGVHIDELTINALTNNARGSAANLLYKIKTQIDRRNIRFDDIMTKINKYQKEEKKDKSIEKLFNKTAYRTKSNFNNSTSKLPELSYMSTFYGTKTNFNTIKPVMPYAFSGKNINTLKFDENKKNENINHMLLNDKKAIKKKLEPITTKKQNLVPISLKRTKDENNELLKLQIDSKNKISEKDENKPSNDSKFYQQQQKKFRSHGKNEQKIKLFSEKYLEDNNNYMKYSCFDNNTLKIGIDIKEIDPKLSKQGIGFNNDYILSDLVLSRLQDIVSQREEEYKKKLEEKKFVSEEERYLKNSIISQNQKNDSGKKFEIHFNKDTQLYKMHEYEKYREKNFPFKEKINSKLLYKKEDNENDENQNENENNFGNENYHMEKTYSSTMDKFYTKTIMTNFSKEYNDFKNKRNFSDFNEDNFFDELERETLSERKHKEIKRKVIREKNYNDIRNLTHLIIDLTDEFYYYQNHQNVEFIEVPEFKKIISNFIEGKINLSSQDKNKNSLVNLEDGNLPKADDKENEEFIYDEKYFSEYNDYIYYRGTWEENKYIPKNFYGSQLQVYQVLGDDINHLTSSGKIITQGLKPSILSKMKNEEFELKENEKDNINVPKENTKNRLLGEIIELNFDNLPYNFALNSINNDLEINNMVKSNGDIKLVSNKKVYLNQDATINNNTNIEDTNYSNNKDLFKINSSNINSTNIINNELNISAVKQDGNKSNNNIEDTLLNNVNNTNINNTNMNINNSNVNQNNENNFSHIPVKICLIGHSFSGRKTQAQLISNKYPKLKYYSLEKIIDDYFNEYERLHTPIENNPKLKNPKKNQIEQLKAQRLEELKQYEEVFKIIEPFTQDNKKCKDLTDEAKITIFIMQLKKDFPAKEGDIYAEVTRRNARKQAIEQDLERIKEEAERKKKYGAKEIREQQLLMKELEDLIKDGYSGFILVDFPNTYNQFVKLENTLTGFVQQIDKEENLRDKYLGLLTFSLDKPYANISNLCPEVMNYLGHGGDFLYKSFFNNYIWLEIDEEETLKRVNDRLIDENTNIIYHKEFNPPPAGDKKLLERLKPVTEPSEEEIKNELKRYDIEFPKNLSYISLFHNLKKISKINKNEVFEDIDEILTSAVKKFEDRENKDEIVALNNFDPDESENIKYFKRLTEVKKKVNKEISGSIISLWSESINAYSKGVKKFLYHYSILKKNILEKMNIMQTIFFQYLNSKTQKQRLVEIFQRKYEVFLDKYHNLRRKKIVKEEFQKDVIELTEHYWEIIQMKKRDSINELKNLKGQNFIENQSELFWDYISKLFILETNFYIKKINIIKKYYYEFEGNKYSEKCPYEYTLSEKDLLKEINDYAIFNKKTEDKKEKNEKSKSKKKEQNKNNSQNNIQDRQISPRIDRIFKNCFKFLFNYDKKMNEISQKEKEKYALNTSNISQISKRKHRGKKSVNDGMSIFSESKNIISFEDEMRAALNNEKIKYKIRISLLKFFGEEFLIEANNICERTFENLDNSIIKSVDAQNTAMNEVMKKLKKDILEGRNKLSYNIELDVFDIYPVLNLNFKEFILNLYNNLDTKDKKIDISELNKIYLDLKNYEIQDNYVTLNSVIDVVFKKHLFEFKSNAFLNYLKELPYHYLNNFIKKFIYKTPAEQSLVRIDRLFTILSILNFSAPKPSQKKDMIDNATNKLKFHCFLSKDDFMNTILWYEKDENKKDNKNTINNSRNINNNIYNLNNQKANAFDYKISQPNVIVEEKNEENLYKDIDLNNKDDINDNDLIISKGKISDDVNINSETRQQMNILFKNLAYKSPSKKGRRASRKISHKSSIPIKIVSEETKLKEFLFNINKNYDNQINFIEFMNVVSLQFIKTKKQKKAINKHLDKNTILNMAKSGNLPKPFKEDRKKTNFSRKTTQFYQTKGGKYEDMYHRASSQSLNKFRIHDIKTPDKQNKNKQIIIGGDSEFNIIKEGEFIIINGKKYSIDSFNENIYAEMTYLDELIEDNPK